MRPFWGSPHTKPRLPHGSGGFCPQSQRSLGCAVERATAMSSATIAPHETTPAHARYDAFTVVEVRPSGIPGRGVFALRALRAVVEIGHYTGRRYAPDETDTAWDGSLTYLFGLSDGSVIDGDEPPGCPCACGILDCRGTMAAPVAR